MSGARICFVDDVVEPVWLVGTVTRPSEEGDGIETRQLSTLEHISSHFERLGCQTHLQCYISICQTNSWGPLQITRPMLSLLAKTYNLDLSIWDLASCFYSKVSDVEDAFCMPFTECRNGPVTEISYTIRYPELRPTGNKWVIRQTGVYHKFNSETSQNLLILFNPTPDSKAHRKAESAFMNQTIVMKHNLFWLHNELFLTYLPAWRTYNAYLEGVFLPMADNAIVTNIDELTSTEYGHLTKLAQLENRLLRIPIILSASKEVLNRLASLCDESLLLSRDSDTRASLRRSSLIFDSHQRNCDTFRHASEYTQQRSQRITQLLANTLSFREQLDSRSQNENMLRLNKTAVFITILTLLYLPASFVATFFGMNFFDLDQDTDRIVGTSMIWLYVLCSVGLTIGTFLLYHLFLDETLWSRITGNGSALSKILKGKRSKRPYNTNTNDNNV